jgi:leucyl/phenylalanyl-tRNA--protein transferase|tara:strand:- start:40 stop:753 length:714 start_codon:yes stop_codon:yes gene_type:complete
LQDLPFLASAPIWFPPGEDALEEPDGLLAIGGELTPQWLVEAYCRGIFPWFDDDSGPIYWWCPSERGVIAPGRMKVSRSLQKTLRSCKFQVTVDQNFAAVIDACAATRIDNVGTWITVAMNNAYNDLHQAGLAHSIEVWQEEVLVGGLYGLSLGNMFFGESMFASATDASKVAFYKLHELLTEWDFKLIDCQMMNPHLASLGVLPMPRAEFLALLERNSLEATRLGSWQMPTSVTAL